MQGKKNVAREGGLGVDGDDDDNDSVEHMMAIFLLVDY